MKDYVNRISKFYPEHGTQRAARLANAPFLAEAALGLAGEAGEVVDIIKKYFAHGKIPDREHLVEELGDTLHYLLRIASFSKITEDEIKEYNVAKLEKRWGNR